MTGKGRQGINIELIASKYAVYILVFISVVFLYDANLLFAYNVSIGEDDSVYLLSAHRFLNHEAFPLWHGSLYPVVLAFLIKLFGFDLYTLKVFTVIFMYGQIPLLYYAFRKYVPQTVLFAVLLFIAVNPFFVSLASYTYSEGLFMLLQALALLAFYLLLEKQKNRDNEKGICWLNWLFLGLSMFLLSLSRNIGWAFFLSVIIYWLFHKKFRNALFTLFSLLVFYLPFNLYKMTSWGLKQMGFEGQFNAIFLKNPYSPAAGYETQGGFVERFLVNSKNYLSVHLLNIFGFNVKEGSFVITLLIYLLFAAVVFHLWRKRSPLLFLALYLAIGVFTTFISQQVFWSQWRLILIFVPLILLLLLKTVYDLSPWISHVLIVLLLALSSQKLVSEVKDYSVVKKSYESGNRLAGFSTDLVHYVNVVEQTRKLPDTAVVAARKPGIAFVYGGGREFVGIYRFPSQNIEKVLDEIKSSGKDMLAMELPYDSTSIKHYMLKPFYGDLEIAIILSEPKTRYMVYLTDSTTTNVLEKKMSDLEIDYINNPDTLRKRLGNYAEGSFAVYFDTLYNFFAKNSIDYVILGSLRKYPQRKTGEVINTVKRYMAVLYLKYPDMFIPVYKDGEDDDEPAFLMRVYY